IAKVRHGPAAATDRQVVQPVDGERAGVQLDVVFRATDLLRARGYDEVLPGDGVEHIHRREALSSQRSEVEIHLDLARGAAIGIRYGGTRHGRNLRADNLVAQVEDLRLGEAIA